MYFQFSDLAADLFATYQLLMPWLVLGFLLLVLALVAPTVMALAPDVRRQWARSLGARMVASALGIRRTLMIGCVLALIAFAIQTYSAHLLEADAIPRQHHSLGLLLVVAWLVAATGAAVHFVLAIWQWMHDVCTDAYQVTLSEVRK